MDKAISDKRLRSIEAGVVHPRMRVHNNAGTPVPIFTALAQEKCGCGNPLPELSIALIVVEGKPTVEVAVGDMVLTLEHCAYKAFQSIVAFFGGRLQLWADAISRGEELPDGWDGAPKVMDVSRTGEVRGEGVHLEQERALFVFSIWEFPPYICLDDEVLRRFGYYMMLAQIIDGSQDADPHPTIVDALEVAGMALMRRIEELQDSPPEAQ